MSGKSESMECSMLLSQPFGAPSDISSACMPLKQVLRSTSKDVGVVLLIYYYMLDQTAKGPIDPSTSTEYPSFLRSAPQRSW